MVCRGRSPDRSRTHSDRRRRRAARSRQAPRRGFGLALVLSFRHTEILRSGAATSVTVRANARAVEGYGCRGSSWSACSAWSSWKVECATSKWSARHAPSSSRTTPVRPLLEYLGVHDDVRREHRRARGDRPDVHVVHVDDAGCPEQVFADLGRGSSRPGSTRSARARHRAAAGTRAAGSVRR